MTRFALWTTAALLTLLAVSGARPVRAAETGSPATETGKPAAGDKDAPSDRKFRGRVLTSSAMPSVRLEFADGFKYAGTQTFILYDVARAEQHFFVDADEQGRIRRMYWVQFEGYLPGNTHSYDYKSTKKVTLGGLEFVADAGARHIEPGSGRPGSDGERARAFLLEKGYRPASDDVLSQRLVHLVDEQKRSELMIIYVEDLAPMKLTAKDLAPDGPAADRWEEISQGLLERAMKGIEITR